MLFTKLQDTTITTLYPTHSRQQIAEIMGIDVLKIKARINILGLKKGFNPAHFPEKIWTEEKTAELLSLVKTLSNKQLAEHFGVTKNAIRCKVYKLKGNGTMPDGENIDTYIKAHPHLTCKAIADHFGMHLSTISKRRLNIRMPKSPNPKVVIEKRGNPKHARPQRKPIIINHTGTRTIDTPGKRKRKKDEISASQQLKTIKQRGILSFAEVMAHETAAGRVMVKTDKGVMFVKPDQIHNYASR